MRGLISVYLIKYTDLGQAKEEILSRYSKSKGVIYTIEYLPSGEPQLIVNCKPSGYVSISHTDGLLAMAFSQEKVGIDVERADREVYPKICKNIEHWTRIEAYAKWKGSGLSKEIISRQLPEDIITTRSWGEYVISICSQSQSKVLLLT